APCTCHRSRWRNRLSTALPSRQQPARTTSRPIPVGHHDRQPHRLTPPGPGHRAHPRPSVGRDLGHWATRRLHHLQHRQPRKHPPAHRQALHRSAAPRPRHAHHLHDAVHHRNPHHHAIASATGTALRAVG